MAIRIPSKNIYSPINNPKVRDNAIDNITVEYNSVKPNNEFNVVVSNIKETNVEESAQTTPRIKIDYSETSNSLNNYYLVRNAIGYRYIIGYSYYDVVIQKKKDNKSIISKLLFEKGGYKNIGLNIHFNKDTKNYTSTYNPQDNSFSWEGQEGDVSKSEQSNDYSYNFSYSYNEDTDRKKDYKNFNFDVSEIFIENTQSKNIMLKISAETSFFELGYGVGEIASSISNIENEKGEEFYNFDKASIVEYDDRYEIKDISVATNIQSIILYSHISQTNGSWETSYVAQGYKTTLSCNQLELSFQGNTIGISTENGSVLVGGGRKPYKIDGNELMQNRHYLRDRYYKTILDYSNGKETATIRCEIDNYYDYDTNKVVIAPFNNQLLDSAKYNELWNATYENGKVSQKSADTIAIEETVAINDYTSSNNAYIKNFDDEKYSDYSDGQSLTLTYYVDGEEKTLEGIVDWDEGTGGRLFLTPDNAWGLNLLYSDGTNKIWGMILLNSQFDENGGFTGVGTGAGIYLLVIGKDTFTAPLISFKIKNALAFHLQGYENSDTMVFETRKFVRSSGRISFAFKKTSDFNYIRFKLNGETIEDTGISYDVSALENGKTYCFSVDVNIDGGQGNIYWENMMLNIGARARPYDAYAEKMTFNMYDEVIPMIMNRNGEDIPLSNNADGTPKVFKVLGLTFSSKGKVFQELSLQEC